MNGIIRIGIVGAGAIGKEHKKAICTNDSCCVGAICDTDLNRAKQLAEGTDARVYSDYREMQEREKLDAVILNLPHFLHKDATIYFLEHNIPTLIEKPFANTVAECDEIIRVAERTKTPLGVGHVQRYFPAHRYLREIVQNNTLGRLCAITETRNESYFPNRPAWFLNRVQAGGGILMNFGAHTLDKIFYITGLDVKSVTAQGSNFLTDDDIEATAQVLLRLSDGSSASLTYCGCDGPPQLETYFYFTNGTARVKWCSELYIAKGTGEFEKIETEKANYIELQLLEFIKLIKGDENELVTPQYGRRVIEVLEEAFAKM